MTLYKAMVWFEADNQEDATVLFEAMTDSLVKDGHHADPDECDCPFVGATLEPEDEDDKERDDSVTTTYQTVWQVTGHAFDGDDECWKCSLCGATRDKAIHDQVFHTKRRMVFVADTALPLHALRVGTGSARAT